MPPRPSPVAAALLAAILLVASACAGPASPGRAAEGAKPPPAAAPSTIVAAPTEAFAEPDVPYVPTPPAVVERMLEMAGVTDRDVVYDLGCGDGRIVIAAAKTFGARGLGVDIDPQRIEEAEANARKAGVEDRVRFVRGDLFATDLRPATVVTLYLLPGVNVSLRPRLLEQLDPGTPVVSHDFDMAEWEPDARERVGTSDIFLWHVPARVEGTWRWELEDGTPRTAHLAQDFQKVSGEISGRIVRTGKLAGMEIELVTRELYRGIDGVEHRYRGLVVGDTIRGVVTIADGAQQRWTARRTS